VWKTSKVKIFRACLATGYVPAIWRLVKLVFITKSGRYSYSGPREFRPTFFLLKTMEMLMDRFLEDETLALMPMHPDLHAYQAGKSVKTFRAEKVLDQQETFLRCFPRYGRGIQ
jgi:hypothetical protein